MWTAGFSGSAFFLIVLPRFDSIAISPWSLTSATLPPGCPEPHDHETGARNGQLYSFDVSDRYLKYDGSTYFVSAPYQNLQRARSHACASRKAHLKRANVQQRLTKAVPRRTFVSLLDLGVSHLVDGSVESSSGQMT